MQLLTVFTLVFIAKTCSTRSMIETSKKNDPFQLVPAVVKILTTCYRDQLSALGFAGNSDSSFIKTLQSSASVPVTLVNSVRRFVSNATVPRKNRYKLRYFVVQASSGTELKKTLTAMKSSLWWNHKACLLILAWLPTSEDGCSKAFALLSEAWKMDLLNSKLVCLDPAEEIWIYTYNPYKASAPDRWNVFATYSGRNGHPWTLFKRRHEENDEMCRDLDFDKTRDLNGYAIRSSMKNYPGSVSVNLNPSPGKYFEGPLGTVCNMIFQVMNATPELLLYNQTKSLSFADESGRDLVMDTVEGRSDILLNERYVTVRENISTTYPYIRGGLGILTKHSDSMSELSKIISVVDRNSRRGICLVIVITVLYFIFFLRQDPMPATLNTLRLICNSSLVSIPGNLAPRFYLGSLFVFVVTVQAIYQGKLASLLTTPIFYPNVDAVEDLVDRGYTVYAYKSLQRFFSPSDFAGRYVPLDKFSCAEYVVNDPLAACILPYTWLIKTTMELNLHLSKDEVFRTSLSFVIRDDWPLDSRVTKITTSMFESRVYSYEIYRPVQRAIDLHKIFLKHQEDQQYQSISLDELSFAFIILGIGITVAALCFIVEIGFPLLKVLVAF